jgi:nucleoside-diphosphate-sugar epimerase
MKKKTKTFLVTGGTGFIGSNICKMLVKEGHKVLVYDNNSRGNLSRLSEIKKEIIFINGDIRNQKKVFKAIKRVNAVIHLAYINGTKYFYTKPDLILDIAVKGMVNILDGCKKYKVKELYIASSSEVYQTPIKVPTDESEMLKIPDIHNSRYSYGGGKIISELMGIHYGKKFFNRLIIFRPHNVYGSEMGNEHVIPEFIDRFKKLKGKKFKIQGTGNEIRTFIYIDDFIKGFNLLIKKGKHLNIYNIGTSEKIQIKNLVNKLSKIFNKKIILSKSSLQKGGTKIRIPDISKIKKLGFRPEFNLSTGLKKTIKISK